MWASNGKPDELMLYHKDNETPDASGLKKYTRNVMRWVEKTFVEDKKKIPPEMKGFECGELYDDFRDDPRSPAELQQAVKDTWDEFEKEAD